MSVSERMRYSWRLRDSLIRAVETTSIRGRLRHDAGDNALWLSVGDKLKGCIILSEEGHEKLKR
jgi:hypothetical protein